jgi:hypothetical protein
LATTWVSQIFLFWKRKEIRLNNKNNFY